MERKGERNKFKARKTPKENWIPKTELGRMVMNGEIKSIADVFQKSFVLKEPEIVDVLVPNLQEELMMIGGHPGKGGGKRRTPILFTARMHKSGRRRKLHALVAVGNNNGLLGIGYASGKDAKSAIGKASQKAKLSIIPIRRGCGSWECKCATPHSIPFKAKGKSGSTATELLPAPKGIRLGVSDEIKKLMKLAGIKDVWANTRGQTSTTVNFVKATFNALKSLNKMKTPEEVVKSTGMKKGVI